MLVEQQTVSVTVDYSQFLLGTPAGQTDLLSMKLPQVPVEDVIAVGPRGILFFAMHADYEARVRIEVHDGEPATPLDGEFTRTGKFEINDEPIQLSSLMGETPWERELAPGSWHFTVAVTGREAARRIHEEMMGDVEYEDMVAEIAAVQQWTLRLCPGALETAEARRAR